MQIARTLQQAAGFGPSALTIGNFDGVHAGHRRLLRHVRELASAHDLKAAALTFDPHPASVVAPERAPRLLSTLEERCQLVREQGIGQILILPFTPELSRVSPEEFVKTVVAGALGARMVVVGESFRFGHKHAGDTRMLKELGETYGYETDVLPPVTCRGRIVSSSEIRRLIGRGDVSLAARMLERSYALTGEVVPGRGVGSKQTVPTLNLQTGAEVLPRNGVYITQTRDLADGRCWKSISNVGHRPTFGGGDLSIETFLLDPLIGPAPARIRVEFCRRIREERRFDSADALRSQILRDVGRAQAFFRRLHNRVARGLH
jgi:riboflavin kinase/FMN adenylyltransferase